MKQCEICNIAFENHKSYSNHIRWKHKQIEYKRMCCGVCDKQIRVENFKKHQDICKLKQCKNCNKNIVGRKTFCNSTCSAIHNNKTRTINRSYITDDWKEVQRKKALEAWNENKHCTQKRIFSSKNERDIVSYFKTNFNRDEWKSGGRLKLSADIYLSRDMWSDKLKVCFEYDGIWHFKDIHGQLAFKQNKDKLLEEWCINHNYRLIRIDESVFKNIEQVVDLIYNKTEQIIKMGNRYN